ncbi:GNAT family N-acetyltransferase [Paucibacter soli]|uniref:GNAT family N-acetyltransferase n=1 Tax=Paucibacter soli TaxID=3133433 RepID=UPI00309D652E
MSSSSSNENFPVLETPRLRLREIVASDAPALLAIHGNAEHMRWFGCDAMADLAAAENLVRTFAGWRQAPNPGTRWGLELKDQPAGLIGSCGLFAWHRGWRKCALGYEIAPGLAGRGLMQEALRAVLDWGFAEMGELHRVEAQIHPDNTASLKLARRLGFVQEGRAREVGFWGGRHHDLLQLSLLRREWQTQ